MNYIATHTPNFTIGVDLSGENSKDYTIISTVEITKDYGIPVIVADNELNKVEYCYAEGYHIWEIYSKHDDEWIGLNHYRRYMRDFPKEQTVLPEPMHFNMHKQYGQCHNIEDLLECESIIDKYFPQYKLNYDKIDVLYPCNMFVMNAVDFHHYCEFCLGVLGIFDAIHNYRTYEDVERYAKEKFPDRYRYQARLQGFLMERLGTIFFLNNFKKNDFITRPIIVNGDKQILG